MELTDVHLRYLMAIHEIAKTTPKVSSQRVAQSLGVSKPSVNYILDVLMKRRMIVKERYGKIYLTDRGVFAVRYYESLLDQVLQRFPLGQLDMSREEQRAAALSMVAALPNRYFDQAYCRLYGDLDEPEPTAAPTELEAPASLQQA